MSTALATQEQFFSNPLSALDFVDRITGTGVSDAQLSKLGALPAQAWSSLMRVAVHKHGVAAPAGIEIPLPDQKDDAYTTEILEGVGIALGTYLGIASVVAGVLAAICSAAGAPALFFAACSAIFGILALGLAALIAFLKWIIQPELHSSIEFGGKGGTLFRDMLDHHQSTDWAFRDFPQSVASQWEVDRVDIWTGNVVDAIQMHWRGKPGSPYADKRVSGRKFGGGGGQLHQFTLQPGEYIASVKVKAGVVVDSVQFKTNMRVSDRFGGGGGDRETTLGGGDDAQGPVIGLLGRAGGVIDALGVQHALQTHHTVAYGGSGGIPFLINLSGMQRLVRLDVWQGAYIDAIQLHWLNQDGALVSGPMYGGYALGGVGGEKKSIEFAADETIQSLVLRSELYVDHIRVVTNKQTVDFGGHGGTERPAINLGGRKLLGFVGRYTKFVDQFGVIFAD